MFSEHNATANRTTPLRLDCTLPFSLQNNIDCLSFHSIFKIWQEKGNLTLNHVILMKSLLFKITINCALWTNSASSVFPSNNAYLPKAYLFDLLKKLFYCKTQGTLPDVKTLEMSRKGIKDHGWQFKLCLLGCRTPLINLQNNFQ